MGIFSGISDFFGSGDEQKSSNFADGNPIKIELHSHLIHAVDDGVQTIEESVQILRTYADLGYKKVITSPHVMYDFYKNGPENVLPKVEEIRAALKAENISIEFESAAEYMIDDGFEKKIDAGNLLCFGGSKKYVLVEMPFMAEPNNLKSCLFNLNIAGYKPVLAHPERYMYYAQQHDKLEELCDQGVLLQINMLSLIGYYSPQVLKLAEWLIEKKMVSFVGSDTHNIKHATLIKEQVLPSKLYKKVCELELLNNEL